MLILGYARTRTLAGGFAGVVTVGITCRVAAAAACSRAVAVATHRFRCFCNYGIARHSRYGHNGQDGLGRSLEEISARLNLLVSLFHVIEILLNIELIVA